jgi:hypothetical protein
MKINRRFSRIIAAASLLAILGVWFAWSRRPDRPGLGPAPLNQSTFLADVVEPITIVSGMSFDDGGSQGLRFKDAQGVVRDLCLERTLSVEREHPETLVLNSYVPAGDHAWRVPRHGIEERATLGLLERWASQDRDAQELDRRYQLYESGAIGVEAFWEGIPDHARVKETAVSIMRTLRARN